MTKAISSPSVCPRSLFPSYIVILTLSWDKTCWTNILNATKLIFLSLTNNNVKERGEHLCGSCLLILFYAPARGEGDSTLWPSRKVFDKQLKLLAFFSCDPLFWEFVSKVKLRLNPLPMYSSTHQKRLKIILPIYPSFLLFKI